MKKKNIKVKMNMKQKIFSLLALLMTAVTASAQAPAYNLAKATGADAHGTIRFDVGEDANKKEDVSVAKEGELVTVTVTPDPGYVVNVVTGEWSAITAAARSQRRSSSETIPTEDAITLTPGTEDPTTGAKTYTFRMIRADAKIGCSYTKILTVKADDMSVYYGEDAPAYTATITGFVDGDNVGSLGGTLRFACDFTVDANAGSTFTITPSGYTSDKYKLAYETGTLTVEKSPVSASFSVRSITKICGDEPFTNPLTTTPSGTVTYRSSDTKVATIDEDGCVTLHRTGKVTIYGYLYVDANHGEDYDFYSLEVKPKEIMSGDGMQISWDGSVYSVTIDEDAAPGTVIPEEICDAHLTYERMLDVSSKTAVSVNGKSNYLCTVCLPFTPYFNAKFYTLTGFSNGTLQFTEITGQAQAFTPYLVSLEHNVAVKNKQTVIIGMGGSVSEDVIAKYDGQSFTNNQDMSFCNETFASDPVDGYQLCGTLRGLTNAQAAEAGAFILQGDGTWGAVKAGNEAVYIPPFRAYVVAASAQSARLTSGFGEGGATGIERIVTTDLDGTERWYDLNGRRIDKPTQKGVYIQNGSKVVVK